MNYSNIGGKGVTLVGYLLKASNLGGWIIGSCLSFCQMPKLCLMAGGSDVGECLKSQWGRLSSEGTSQSSLIAMFIFQTDSSCCFCGIAHPISWIFSGP